MNSELLAAYSNVLDFYTLVPSSIFTMESWSTDDYTDEAWFKSFTRIFTNSDFLLLSSYGAVGIASDYAMTLGGGEEPSAASDFMTVTDFSSYLSSFVSNLESAATESSGTEETESSDTEETESSDGNSSGSASSSSSSTSANNDDEETSDSTSSGDLGSVLVPSSLGALSLVILALL